MLLVHGDANFRRYVTNQFKKLASVRARGNENTKSMTTKITIGARLSKDFGTKLITELVKSDDIIDIYAQEHSRKLAVLEKKSKKKVKEISYSTSSAHEKPGGGRGANIMIGRYLKEHKIESGITKIWDPEKRKKVYMQTTKWERVPNHIILGHELIHALHIIQNTYQRKCQTTVYRYIDVDGLVAQEEVSGEEICTIGLARVRVGEIAYARGRRFNAKVTREITENNLRNDSAIRARSGRRPGKRVGYLGRDPKTGFSLPPDRRWRIVSKSRWKVVDNPYIYNEIS